MTHQGLCAPGLCIGSSVMRMKAQGLDTTDAYASCTCVAQKSAELIATMPGMIKKDIYGGAFAIRPLKAPTVTAPVHWFGMGITEG